MAVNIKERGHHRRHQKGVDGVPSSSNRFDNCIIAIISMGRDIPVQHRLRLRSEDAVQQHDHMQKVQASSTGSSHTKVVMVRSEVKTSSSCTCPP